ncbi:prepilin peptidase [Sulfitobacter mediterraneus]|uniref:prepilin peptidase n=1 Tax=Sulfitobacter mediterraneus TaxID=83219 RepID=UPI0019321A3E|nr:prepilin peptidase [Sulfitobacter mediterraneus]MBM1631255.1 prepilin peptidase [Sulfitobacter mediterraneus]MBM1639068.1 prepilin peptidase [Sulfitobacter mediterraneus]MBM1643117.1 prepilin peptidase [Sulfitobacter mediterraneus]MBM1647165.1 prepilin peptidase [Sulfitobacter mediterraneus]MBM1651208.1 prepilin peptidase [Sulfitobacter mediterraneus]
MAIVAAHAWWFLPFVLPICLYVAFTDMAEMRITNPSVLLLALVFVVLGFFLMPFDAYLWRLAALGIVLVVGMVLNAAGALGAGDAKFAAAAAPYVALGDLGMLTMIFMTTLLAAAVTHRSAKYTPLRRLAPHWESWTQNKKFPMGLALGPALTIYLILGAIYGA